MATCLNWLGWGVGAFKQVKLNFINLMITEKIEI